MTLDLPRSQPSIRTFKLANRCALCAGGGVDAHPAIRLLVVAE